MKKTSTLFLLLLIAVLFYVDPNTGSAHSVKTALFTLLFLLTCAWLTRHKWGVPFVALIALFFCAVQGMRVFIWLEYHATINDTLAETFLATPPAEAIAMSLMYWPYLLLYLFVSALFYMMCRMVGRCFREVTLRGVAGVFVIYFTVTSSLYAFTGKSRSDDFVWGETLTKHTPFYALGDFFRVQKIQNLIDEVKTYQPEFHYDVVNDEIENYVLVIGESVRRSDLSLYGRMENTTPQAIAQQKNMLVFNQAVSPAPVTILSVPASIANIPLGHTGNFAVY